MGESFVPASLLDHAAGLARLVFAMFVYLTDSDGNINVQDVRRFQSLLKDPSWTNSADLRGALFALQVDYTRYWAQYDEQRLGVSRDMIVEGLDEALRSCDADRGAALKQGLERFLDRVDRVPYGLRPKERDQRGRARAHEELQSILAMSRDQLAEFARNRSSGSGTVAEATVNVSTPWPVAQLTPASGMVWAGSKTRVRCVGVTTETHDSKTYTFTAVPPTLFHYKPGQFITVGLSINGRIVQRSYTISSSPSRPYALSVTVKRVQDGQVSNWLFDNMAEGLEFDIAGPAGRFTCLNHPAEKLLLLAAGSGITPTMSMLRWLADTLVKVDIVFIDSVRTPQDIIFQQELHHLSAILGERLRLGIVPARVPTGQIWHGYRGHFDEALLRSLAPDFLQREVFVCGPSGYMETVKSLLARLDFPMEHYHNESFGGTPIRKAPPTTELPPAPVAPETQINVPVDRREPAAAPSIDQASAMARASVVKTQNSGVVKIQDSGASFVVAAGQTILEAAESQGVALNYSCRSGTCGTCRMLKISGELIMEEQSPLSEEDLQYGYILTCVGRIKGSVTLAQSD